MFWNSHGFSGFSNSGEPSHGRNGRGCIVYILPKAPILEEVCCTVLKKEEVDRFHEHLNGVNAHIQFTAEIEENKSLPFLDILLLRQEDGSIKTSVFRKPTHTDKYLDFNSHHPLAHKSSVVRHYTTAPIHLLQPQRYYPKKISTYTMHSKAMDILKPLFIRLRIKFEVDYLMQQQNSLQFKKLNQLLL